MTRLWTLGWLRLGVLIGTATVLLMAGGMAVRIVGLPDCTVKEFENSDLLTLAGPEGRVVDLRGSEKTSLLTRIAWEIATYIELVTPGDGTTIYRIFCGEPGALGMATSSYVYYSPQRHKLTSDGNEVTVGPSLATVFDSYLAHGSIITRLRSVTP